MELLDRFLRYVAIDTQSDPESDAVPSTPGQTEFLRMLAAELAAMGATEVEHNDRGYLTATVPASAGCGAETVIGFLAHVDTSPDAPGANVRPQLTERDGDTVITSDGTTLLGADDKAGVAIVMSAAEHLLAHPGLRHGPIRLAFTTDEEIGRGADLFDAEAFGAAYAYTVDGGALGELEYENFNAGKARVTFRGRSAHPGYAKGEMLNALMVAKLFDCRLPGSERPETTEGRQGFFHLVRLEGSVAAAEAEYLIRDHDRGLFERRNGRLLGIAEVLNESLGAGTVTVELSTQYYNMYDVVSRHPEIIERAKAAMLRAGVTPEVVPIRGGTDGARLSYMGLPCPNLFTGGRNFHSLSESASLAEMTKAMQTVINIALMDEAHF